jgi:hypothetical protein
MDRVFENWVLKKMFGYKSEDVTGEWRKLHNYELHNLCSAPNIIRVIKSMRKTGTGHVKCIGENRNRCKILVGKPEEDVTCKT